MNSVEKELHGYINGTERFSGYDSYDSMEGDYGYFDEDGSDFDDFSTADAFSFASGSSSPAQLSDPYVIQYTSTALVTQQAILFGYNDYFQLPNFGNVGTTTITNLQTGTLQGYGRLVAQSNNKNFKIGKWRFQSVNASQLAQTLQLNHVDANGKQYSTPLNLSIMRDAYQQQSDILDVTKTITIDGNTFISFPILAGTTLVISMFPIAIVSAKAVLNGGTSLNKAKAPRLSGKNVAPVIIQTSQNVKGITKA
jgi:hypothetical protein